MESDHWQRVKKRLSEALEQPPAAREEFVRKACGPDNILLQDVLKLLDSHSRAGGTLSQPLFPLALPAQDQPPRFSPSMVLGRRFRIIRLIARGGMGDVYEAADLQLGVHVALKTIRPDIAADERVLDLFKNEIQTARRVTHPNVCRIYDLAEHSEPVDGGEETTTFLTMELLAGEPLSDHLKTHGTFSREQALPLVHQLASALEAAHQAGVIHRDFKPGNVMLTASDAGERRAVITDFGLAVVRAQSHLDPLPGAVGGTPNYMAPEQIQGGEVTTSNDIYTLGLVIAEMIGARIQPASPAGAIIRVPPDFRRWTPVLLRCLETDPAKRYSRPMMVVDALAAASASGPAWSRLKAVAIVAASLIVGLALTALLAQRYGEVPTSNRSSYRKLLRDDNIGHRTALFLTSFFGMSPAPLRFETASIKPANAPVGPPGTGLKRWQTQDGSLNIHSPVPALIMMGFGLRPYQLLGGPAWINSTWYDIEAKAKPNATMAEANLMLRSLLEDRFKLKFHYETRVLPVYQIVAAKGGSKLRESQDQNPRRGASAESLMPRPGEIAANGIALKTFANLLSPRLDRPVIDKTGLKGLYDIVVRWTPDFSGNLQGIFTAIEEQLGLRLEAVSGPLEVVVVDSVERPKEN